MAFSDPLVTTPQVKAGRVRALAVSGPQRLESAPDILTVAEAGVPLLGRRVARHRGPGGDAARSHRHAQRRGEQGAREPGRPQAADRQRGADHARHPGGLRRLSSEHARWKKVVTESKLVVD
jgi:tripartite-type tricarboxylate transporter receptor subunit TctC